MTGKEIFILLAQNDMTVGFAESMTCGLASYQIVENPGASRVLRGSLVTYAESVKYDVLGINYRFIEEHGIVSEPVAKAMAESVRLELGSNIGVGITGDAGPTLQFGSEKRQVFVAAASGTKTLCESIVFDKESRVEAIQKAVELAYALIYKMIVENG